MHTKNVAVVFGTYQRYSLLVRAVESVRRNAGCSVCFVIVDGGSEDESRPWLANQPDVVLIGQRGPLSGATRAFNKGFGYCVDEGFDYVVHLNDDCELLTDGAIAAAVEMMEGDCTIGGVAFEFDLRPGQKFEYVHGRVYSNFGVIRATAGIAAAVAQGDPSGKKWWSERYRTYGADCEFSCWIWRLGWRIIEGSGLCVHDCNHQDALRKANLADVPDRPDSRLFWSRWSDPASIEPFRNASEMKWQGAKLHLGCGDKRLPGWVNMDGRPTPAADIVGDAFAILRSIPQGSLQWIYASHFIEHVHPDKLPELFVLMHSALAPGGKLSVVTIDLGGIYQNRYMSNRNGANWNSALYGETNSTDHPYAAHRQCFDYGSLSRLFDETGFASVRSWQPEEYAEIAALNDYGVSCRLVSCFAEGVK